MRILLIDDDVNLNKVVAYQLRQQDYEVTTANNGLEGLEQFQKNPFDIIISDIQMPDINGIDLLQKIRKKDKAVIFIMITAYGSIDSAIKACRLGADDYLTKPFSKEQLSFTIEKALRIFRLQNENLALKEELKGRFRFDNMVAGSGVMQDVLKTAVRVADSDASVLILGESGTGKELIARAIHYNSPRKDQPLVIVNCPSIPDNLMESELFGHVKGAFTGAVSDRAGKFEQADGGTIFLDEIGELKGDLQARLLRVLQQKSFDRVGGSKPVEVDVRVIAATNRDLQQMVKQQQFRDDLYYRLSVVPIHLPPLRERKEDIPALVESFLRKFDQQRRFTITTEAMQVLQQYPWPGNVRELENIIERLITLAGDTTIDVADLPDYIRFNENESGAFSVTIPEEGLALEDVERRIIKETLKRSDGNQSRAARLLKIPRHVLLYRMKKLGIENQ